MLVLLKVVLPVNMTFLKLILWNMQLKKVTSENVVKSIFPMHKKEIFKIAFFKCTIVKITRTESLF